MTRRPRIRPGEEWKTKAACRRAVHDYMDAGWSFERAQRYVSDLYYVPGDGKRSGRPPKVPPPPEADAFFLPRFWCSMCPVAEECLDEAVATRDHHGFRAGYTPTQLVQVVKTRRRALAESG